MYIESIHYRFCSQKSHVFSWLNLYPSSFRGRINNTADFKCRNSRWILAVCTAYLALVMREPCRLLLMLTATLKGLAVSTSLLPVA